MSELRHTEIRRSLNRSHLLLGGERELVLLTGLISFTLIVVGFSVWICLTGVGIWLFCIAVLRQMAKADPMMSRVYLRHVKLHHYYPANVRFWRD